MVWRIGRGDNTCSGVVTKLRESNGRRDLSLVLHERFSLYIIDCIYLNWRRSSPQQSTYRARSFPRTHLRAHQQESKNRTPWELHLDPRANSQVLRRSEMAGMEFYSNEMIDPLSDPSPSGRTNRLLYMSEIKWEKYFPPSISIQGFSANKIYNDCWT